MELIKFGSDDVANEISRLSSEDFDNLAFGAVLLDADGTILKYNKTEGQICHRDPKEMIGKNFFTEVAPCTDTREFHGRFDAGIASGDLNVILRYTFDVGMPPTEVQIQMRNAARAGAYWIIVKRV